MRKKRTNHISQTYNNICYTSYARTLLRLVFNISSPIAPVYIIAKLDSVEIINTYIATYRENHGKHPKTIPNDDVLVFMP